MREVLLLSILLAVAFLLAASLRTEFFPARDSRENLLIAFNLHHYGTYSVRQAKEGVPPAPTTKREPLYPTLLSSWMSALDDNADNAKHATLDSLTPAFVRNLKLLNAFLHACLVLASWWAARVFFQRAWPALAVAALIAINSSMLSQVDVFLTEIPAATLLAASSAHALPDLHREENRLSAS